MVQPHAIRLRGADRDAGQAALHLADVVDELGNLDQVLVDRLVADGDAVDAAVVGGERNQVVDLLLVPLRIDVDPGAGHHAQAHLVGHGRDAEIGADGRIGADLAGQPRHQRQVAADLRQGRLLAIGRVGVVAERGVGEAGDVLGPGVLLDRPIQQHPGAGKQHRHHQADHPVRETHVFRFRDARLPAFILASADQTPGSFGRSIGTRKTPLANPQTGGNVGPASRKIKGQTRGPWDNSV